MGRKMTKHQKKETQVKPSFICAESHLESMAIVLADHLRTWFTLSLAVKHAEAATLKSRSHYPRQLSSIFQTYSKILPSKQDAIVGNAPSPGQIGCPQCQRHYNAWPICTISNGPHPPHPNKSLSRSAIQTISVLHEILSVLKKDLEARGVAGKFHSNTE
jgi:hypothetical protein